jgi:hypothetical protein
MSRPDGTWPPRVFTITGRILRGKQGGVLIALAYRAYDLQRVRRAERNPRHGSV